FVYTLLGNAAKIANRSILDTLSIFLGGCWHRYHPMHHYAEKGRKLDTAPL
ncbi:hypothetical protein Pgy4_38091, partial [Pseudomonas savastanoi pv. glycinea str. race 4]